MTTRTGARVYRGASTPLAENACAHCGRVVSISRAGRRRHHVTPRGEHCTGGGVMVGDPLLTELDELPPVVMPQPRGRPVQPQSDHVKPTDPRLCECGWRPRRKGDGTFAAHRVRADDFTAPYCLNGAERSY